MKLELKHLAPYLPYKLKMKCPQRFRPNYKESTGVYEVVYLTGDLYADIENDAFNSAEFKPILKPLSYLTKEIDRDKTILHQIAIELGLLKDDNFLFQYNFSDYGSFGNKYDYAIITPNQRKLISIPQKAEDLKNVSYRIFEKLLENHIDVFGLIDKGVAVSEYEINP